MKRFTKTGSIGSAAFDALRRSASGDVHSVFDRIFNILIGGELVGVARSGISKSNQFDH